MGAAPSVCCLLLLMWYWCQRDPVVFVLYVKVDTACGSVGACAWIHVFSSVSSVCVSSRP